MSVGTCDKAVSDDPDGMVATLWKNVMTVRTYKERRCLGRKRCHAVPVHSLFLSPRYLIMIIFLVSLYLTMPVGSLTVKR
jgi:hypothetical protein